MNVMTEKRYHMWLFLYAIRCHKKDEVICVCVAVSNENRLFLTSFGQFLLPLGKKWRNQNKNGTHKLNLRQHCEPDFLIHTFSST